MLKHISATVPQGVGDIFWCYQKLKPHCEEISFKIAVLNPNDTIEARSEKIIAALPGVRHVGLQVLKPVDYRALIAGVFDLNRLLKTPGDDISINYSVNNQLDNGVRLENIDANAVLYDIQPITQQFARTMEEYAVFYVSGATAKATNGSLSLWTAEQWATLINEVSIPVILIGAQFDRVVMDKIKQLCPKIMILVQLEPDYLFHVIKNAAFFVGYQSGMSILADNFKVKHLIVYFNHLPAMRDAWGHPDRRNTHFHYCFFKDGPSKALRIIKERLCT